MLPFRQVLSSCPILRLDMLIQKVVGTPPLKMKMVVKSNSHTFHKENHLGLIARFVLLKSSLKLLIKLGS
jgi:hypothetical protein